MEKLLQAVMYFSWALWLVYSYVVLFSRKQKPDRKLLAFTFFALVALVVLLQSRMMIQFSVIALLVILFGMLRRPGKKQRQEFQPSEPEPQTLFHSFFGMGLATIAIVSLFFLLGLDFKSDSHYFIEKYNFKIDAQNKQEMVIGNSKEDSDITIENNSSDKAHLRLTLHETDFSVQNISGGKRVDLNGRYLNKLVLKEGDEIEIMGKDNIKLLRINKQYPLGRAVQVSVKKTGREKDKTVTLHTLLNKSFIIQYRDTGAGGVSAGLNKLLLPGRAAKAVASISYEPNRYFLGMNIYYIIVFLTVLLLSICIYLYLKNRFNGALLLLLMASLPFMAGFIPVFVQVVIILVFIPFIIYVQRRRKPGWHWGTILPVLLFAALFILPLMLRMDGDFTLQYYDFAKKDALRITRGKETFQLKDTGKKLAYNKKHALILGHTGYEMTVGRDNLSLIPKNPEKIRISPGYKAIISDLSLAAPGDNYLYLKFPHQFAAIPFESVKGKERLVVADKKGNSMVLSKTVSDNYSFYLRGLVFYVLLPFWFFLVINYPGLALPFAKNRRLQLELFNKNNLIIYNLVFFMLGLGYVVFGALALYNNSYFKNFEKYRDHALPLFVGLFFLSLLLSRYNRWLVFLYRALIQKKFHVPLITGLILILLVNYSRFFLYAGILFFIFVFLFRLRRDLVYEYKRSPNYPLDIKKIIEKTITGFEDKTRQRIFFGLGGVLNNKGWNYLLVSDLLLLLALFFIFLQMFLGGELGVSVAGFFFMPIELGKILLTIYFADWVSRIDKGMELNVLWVYGLVMIPFVLLVFFLKDFSPLLVFSFVFLYHIIKIKKPLIFKLFLAALLFVTLVTVVADLGRYTFPFGYFSIILSLVPAVFLLRVWFKKTKKPTGKPFKIAVSSVLVLFILAFNYAAFFHAPSAPKSLAGRVSSWLNPWQDYNLSYQYVNSLWLMKGAGTFGKSADALTTAANVPLIEKDLSFSLYVSVLGIIGTAFIFFTLFMIAAYVHKLGHKYERRGRNSPFRWYLYLLEFLAVIFLAQFLVPALYVVGLLPIMGQPLPFLSYSNNMLLLFALPFSFLMIVLGNNIDAAARE